MSWCAATGAKYFQREPSRRGTVSSSGPRCVWEGGDSGWPSRMALTATGGEGEEEARMEGARWVSRRSH